MDPARWHRVEELFNRALDLDASRRAEFLEHACGEDELLRRELESLLAHEQKLGISLSRQRWRLWAIWSPTRPG